MGHCLPSRPCPSVRDQRQHPFPPMVGNSTPAVASDLCELNAAFSFANVEPHGASRLSPFPFPTVLLPAGIQLQRQLRARAVLYPRHGHTLRVRQVPIGRRHAADEGAAAAAAVVRRRGPLPASAGAEKGSRGKDQRPSGPSLAGEAASSAAPAHHPPAAIVSIFPVGAGFSLRVLRKKRRKSRLHAAAARPKGFAPRPSHRETEYLGLRLA